MKDTNNNNSKPLSDVFLNRSFAFLHNLENYLEDPIEENIHQSRVSGRKLESLFEAFGHLSDKDYKIHFKQIVDIIKLFSASRETDVCITLTKEYYKQIKVENLIVSNFLNHLIRNSKLQRKKIMKINAIEAFINVKESFEKFIRYDLFEGAEFVSLETARNYTILIVPKLYNKVFAYSEVVLNNPSEKKKLHKMRLKAKPLRYLLEFANEVFDCKLDDLQNQIKEFVEQAGLIHDIDMLIERVNRFSELLSNLKHKGRLISKGKSLNVFIKYLNSRRKEEYDIFCDMILRIESGNTKQKLIKKLAANVNKT